MKTVNLGLIDDESQGMPQGGVEFHWIRQQSYHVLVTDQLVMSKQ